MARRSDGRDGVVYGLFDGATGELRYVGQTVAGLRFRLYWHKSKTKKGTRTPLYEWLGGAPGRFAALQAQVLEGPMPAAELDDAERWHIAYFRSIGCDLLNVSTGGPAFAGVQHLSPRRPNVRHAAARERAAASARAFWGGGSERALAARAKARDKGSRIVDDLGNRYRSFSDAGRAIGTSAGNVRNQVVGILKSIKGRRFRMEEAGGAH